MPDWINEWTAVGAAIVTILGYFGIRVWRRREEPPRQQSGDRGVNIGGDNSGDINTGSQSAPRKK